MSRVATHSRDSRRARSICIITPGYLSSSPRTVKEADALMDAGYRVHVVSSLGDLAHVRPNDALVHARRSWSWNAVGWSRRRRGERLTFWWTGVRQRTASSLPRRLWRLRGVAEMSEGRLFPELARLAGRCRADLYIGHYPAGLAAAAAAARQNRSAHAYDVEDAHTLEGGQSPLGRRTAIHAGIIEQRYAANAAYVTASSQGIADAFALRFGVPAPHVIHNVFPWKARAAADGLVKDRDGVPLSLFWFSQTIGLSRGVVEAIRAIALVDGPVQLHLRGTLAPATRRALLDVAAESGVEDRVHFHAQVPPDELLSRAMEHDAGLALEQGHTGNNAIAASNKLFLYMLAGLAIAATDVPGQRRIAESTPGAIRLVPPGDVRALADVIAQWRRDPDLLARDRSAALAAARDRWNWERESAQLVALVDSALGSINATARRA